MKMPCIHITVKSIALCWCRLEKPCLEVTVACSYSKRVMPTCLGRLCSIPRRSHDLPTLTCPESPCTLFFSMPLILFFMEESVVLTSGCSYFVLAGSDNMGDCH